ncbi:thiamine-phosphate kinase [Leptothrix ochracea]|uniref:thiamine-phosphate kinase n=1 Tax=Leptothrix ochracea TaxID=735331 RepID=UPI0034E1CBFD
MASGEFDLIARYFTRPTRRQPLGVGDDCALLAPQAGRHLAVSSDMLVEGRHFLSTVAPEHLGHKALAVNLSDLAACGAKPMAYTLALALPRMDATFLAGFAQGLHRLADEHGIELVGGDTTAGPLNICITVFGEVPHGQALLRSGARAGDDIWVSGQLGDARLGLEALRGTVALSKADFTHARRALECPTPRVALGLALRGVARSAIDLSDGLVGDLRHILARSASHAPIRATLDIDALPRSGALRRQSRTRQHLCLMSGGDDYELLFTAEPAKRAQVLAAAAQSDTPVSRIGRMEAATTTTSPDEALIRVLDAQGMPLSTPWTSFDHFTT